MPKGRRRLFGFLSAARAAPELDRRAREALPVRMNTLLVGPFLFLQAADPQPPVGDPGMRRPNAIGVKRTWR